MPGQGQGSNPHLLFLPVPILQAGIPQATRNCWGWDQRQHVDICRTNPSEWGLS